MVASRRHAQARLAGILMVLALAGALLSLAVGSQGWEPLTPSSPAFALVLDIRLPRTLGVMALGGLLGLSGAVAQGLFRNPLADPYLLGSGSGAALTVTALAAATAGATSAWLPMDLTMRLGVTGAAFAGAVGGVMLTLLLARGAQHTHRLLLAGLVVGVVMGSLTDLMSAFVPDAWRQRQSLLLGHTNLFNVAGAEFLWSTLLVALPLGMALARVMDALTLGEDAALSLGLPLGRMRLALVALMAGCTAVAVSQAGLVLFVGLVAPHIVRHLAPSGHRFSLPASAGAGAVLLLGADIASRWLLAPQEIPVGVVTGVAGGLYLLALLNRRGVA